MKACQIEFRADVADTSAAEKTLKYKAQWDSFIDTQNKEASVTGHRAYHLSGAWVRAEAELAIIESTEVTIALSALCSALGILLFTRDPWLMVVVMLLVIGIICGLGFFMITIMSWKVGPIEVIALVVFVGYSVTYSLHIAHDYSRVGEDHSDLQNAERYAMMKLSKGSPDSVQAVQRPLPPRQLRLARARPR